jgi:hypothetical protein
VCCRLALGPQLRKRRRRAPKKVRQDMRRIQTTSTDGQRKEQQRVASPNRTRLTTSILSLLPLARTQIYCTPSIEPAERCGSDQQDCVRVVHRRKRIDIFDAPSLHQELPVSFNPTIPAMIRKTHMYRATWLGSFSSQIPRKNVPTAPIPVQTA